MPKYLFEARYTADGAKGLAKEGGTKRLRAAQRAFEGVNGKVEAFYYAFGRYDVYVLADFPSHAHAAAASLAINSSGLVTIRTTVLLTPKEIDAASKKTVKYRGPGQ